MLRDRDEEKGLTTKGHKGTFWGGGIYIMIVMVFTKLYILVQTHYTVKIGEFYCM